MPDSVTCTNCGSENPAGTEVCARCGQPLAGDVGDRPRHGSGVPLDLPTVTSGGAGSADEAVQPSPVVDRGATEPAPIEEMGEETVTTATGDGGAEPPSAMPPSGAGPGGTAPPSLPRRHISAGMAAAIGVGALIVLGVLFKGAFGGSGGGAITKPTTTTVRHPTTPPNHPPTKPPVPKPGPERVVVSGCRSIGSDKTCQGAGFTIPAQSASFEVMVWVQNSKAGQRLEIDYLDPQTGQAIVGPNDFTLRGQPDCVLRGLPQECVTVTFNNGPFPQVDMELAILLGGQTVNFTTPPILHLV